MIEIEIDELQKFYNQLFPLKYKSTLIYTKELPIYGRGAFGFRKNNLIFYSEEFLIEEKEYKVEIPESIEEIEEFLAAADYIIQRLTVAQEIILTIYTKDKKEYEPISFREAVKPFLNIIKNYSEKSEELMKLRYS
jgi:hypothetical protein